jgi:hypothetical protein
MKKEYVKPQNRVVYLTDRLMDDPWVSQGGDNDNPDAKFNYSDDSDAYSDDIWED